MRNFVSVVCVADLKITAGIRFGEMVFFLGGDGHCAVANADGKVIWGYHTDNFIEIDGIMIDEQLEISDKMEYDKETKRWILPEEWVEWLINEHR